VIVNEAPFYRAVQQPYGGVRDSGFGREGVDAAMEEMTEPRLLVLPVPTAP
jgi:acyl-CoA reductase-like NAD-dependent aldehyde dehydrogenase